MMDADRIRKLLKRVAIGGVFFLLAFVFYQLGWRSVLIGYALVVTVIMILVILLQSGRGGGLASMGGMGGNKMLGARAATPIAKATYVMGALFLFICILIARLGNIQASKQPVLQPDAAQTTQETNTTDSKQQPETETNSGTPATPDTQQQETDATTETNTAAESPSEGDQQ